MVVTVTQPWQRSKLFDYTKKRAVTDKLQEHFYIRDKEEQDWDRVVKTFPTKSESTATNQPLGQTYRFTPQDCDAGA